MGKKTSPEHEKAWDSQEVLRSSCLPYGSVLSPVDADFIIGGNNALTSISGFSALPSVGSLQISSHAALVSISGFDVLSSVDGDFDIEDNAALTSLSGFPALNSVDILIIDRNDALTSISGFDLLDASDISFSSVFGNPNLDCQNPVPTFVPVDISTGNSVNCP